MFHVLILVLLDMSVFQACGDVSPFLTFRPGSCLSDILTRVDTFSSHVSGRFVLRRVIVSSADLCALFTVFYYLCVKPGLLALFQSNLVKNWPEGAQNPPN